MGTTKVLFLAGLISLTGYSMQDNCQVGTRVGHTSCDPAIGTPNPASVYCTENGGRLEDRPSTRGADAVCVFENSECGQWAYKNGECNENQCARWSTESDSCEIFLVDVGSPEDCGQVGIAASSCGPDCPTVGATCDDECEDGCDEATTTETSACGCDSGNAQEACDCCGENVGQTDSGCCGDSPAQEGCDASQAPSATLPVVSGGGCSN